MFLIRASGNPGSRAGGLRKPDSGSTSILETL
jgi:hypothetical protein